MHTSTMEDEDLNLDNEGADEDGEFWPPEDDEDCDDSDLHCVDRVVAKDNTHGLILSLQGWKEHARIPTWLDEDYKMTCQAL